MSNLIELLSDLAILESTPSDMDNSALSLIFNMKEQLDHFLADLTISAPLAATSSHNDEYSMDSAHYDEVQSFSQSTESSIESMHAPSLQAKPGLGLAALSKSTESRSGTVDANRLQVNSNGNETHSEPRFGIINSDHMVINAFNQGLPTLQPTNIALERPAATGRYYHLSASQSSTSSPTPTGLSIIPFLTRGNTTQNKHVVPGASGHNPGATFISDEMTSNSLAGPSKNESAIRANAAQMKRALSKASSRTVAGGAQKKAKGDMDPENHEIYRLRQQNKQFDEIAEIINKVRATNGKPSNLTGNAIYGRYKRNASLIAAAKGEVFKPCELDLQAGTNLRAITQPVPAGFDENDDLLLVEAYKYVMDNTWLLVSKRLEETTGRSHDPADCANRYAYL